MSTMRVGWFRFRATFARRRDGFLAMVLMIALVGGLALSAVAGARRTQSSFPAYLGSTNPSDLNFLSAAYNPAAGSPAGYNAALLRTIGRLPHVKHVESYAGPNLTPIGLKEAPTDSADQVNLDASIGREFFAQDRVTVIRGRMSDPRRANEVVVSPNVARNFSLRVGEIIPAAIFTNEQQASPQFGSPSLRPHARIDLRLVGIAVFNDTVVQDDVDATGSSNVVFTPALTRRLLDCCVSYTVSLVQLDDRHNVGKVESEIGRLLPKGSPPNFQVAAAGQEKAERSVRPEALALGVFGAIAALALFVIGAQLIGRQLRVGAADLPVLRAVGASAVTTSTDGLIGTIGAVTIGSVAAGTVAIDLSPVAPLGPVRSVYPTGGIAADWTVIGAGVATMIIALSATAFVIGFRLAPHRVARGAVTHSRPSFFTRAASTSGLPAPAISGMNFALEPGRGPNAVSIRSAILGTALAMIVLVATLTFGASLNALVSHPSLYGWNWDLELVSQQGYTDIPAPAVTRLLNRDPDIAAWTGVYFGAVSIDAHTVPVLGTTPNARVAPPLLSGRALRGPREVVLGATTLTQLRKRLGDSVTIANGSARPTHLRIVGTATMPAIGQVGSVHPTLGTGALVAYSLIPAESRNAFGSPVAGPNAVLLRFRSGTDRAAALHRLRKAVVAPAMAVDGGVTITSAQRPAEIVNYHSMRNTAAFLGIALAVAAVGALALTLVASVRQRRRDLALLKALGFTNRQLAATLAWQATIAVALGTALGIPLGIFAGRSVWILFAHNIHAVPRPAIPLLPIGLVAVGALLLANLIAAVPRRRAARTPSALLLQRE